MKQSQLFGKTSKTAPKDETSANAILLEKAGYIAKLMSGVYSYLPLGLRVLDKIKTIIKEEMNAIGGQEILMPALQPKENWQKTGRWDSLNVLLKLEGSGNKEYALGSTHEEIVTPLVQHYASSYKELPVAVYQIQDKFRDEPRAKSGLLRGREFSMKDLYSFHVTPEDLDAFYEKAKEVYFNIFAKCGLEVLLVEASGGTFSKYSHEFQVVSENGEDTIITCSSCNFAQNKEICDLNEGDKCPKCQKPVNLKKTIEVGNIFKLSTKYSDAFNYKYTAQDGSLKPVLMGCYGIGPSRIMGTVVELFNDANGLKWPLNLAPFQAHLLLLDPEKKERADKLYQELTNKGFEVLYDDRDESAGVKFKDADLIGLPWQIVIGTKTNDDFELKNRLSGDQKLINQKKLFEILEAER